MLEKIMAPLKRMIGGIKKHHQNKIVSANNDKSSDIDTLMII